MAEPVPPNSRFSQIIKQNSDKPINLSDQKSHLSVGEEAAIAQLSRLFGMPGLAGDALRLLVVIAKEAAKGATSETSDRNLYLLFLIANAEVRSRKLRTP